MSSNESLDQRPGADMGAAIIGIHIDNINGYNLHRGYRR